MVSQGVSVFINKGKLITTFFGSNPELVNMSGGTYIFFIKVPVDQR